MPFMDGYQCSKKILELMVANQLDEPNICAVTGHTEPDFVKQCYDCGMIQVFNKPVNIEALRKTLQSLGYVE